MRTAPVPLADIVAALGERIATLVAELLPNGTCEGHEYRIGSVAGEPGRSMCVWITGTKQGQWYDFGASIGGDGLHLVAHVLFRGSIPDAMRWSRAWLGIDALDPASIKTYRQAAAVRAEEAKQEDERKRAAAFRIYMESVSLPATPAAAYLAGRGIDVGWLAAGRRLQSLRYHGALWNEESKRKWPALVGGIVLESRLVGVHRTWLHRDKGQWIKAPLTEPKMTLGRYAGGAIRLWRGASGKPWRDRVPGEWIMLAEGIEDAGSGVMGAPEYRTWAAVSLANMGSIVLPDDVAGVLILAQNDTEPDAIKALDRAIISFQRQGKRVRLAKPPQQVKDVNDVLRLEAIGGLPDHGTG